MNEVILYIQGFQSSGFYIQLISCSYNLGTRDDSLLTYFHEQLVLCNNRAFHFMGNLGS